MAHFAEIGLNNTVLRVIVINNAVLLDENNNEIEAIGSEFCRSTFGGTWLQTSFNGSIRKNFASVGSVYDQELDAFIPPKPYPSWLLNTEEVQWYPPVSKPDDGNIYVWNENTQTWDPIS